MPEETNAVVDSADSPDDGDSELIRNLRQQIKDQHKLIDAYQPLARDEALRQAGFDPTSGDAKLLADFITANKGEFTKDSVLEVANKYGKTPDAGDGGGGGETTPGSTDPAAADAAKARANAAGAVDGLLDGAPPSPDAQTERERKLARVDETFEEGNILENIALQRDLAGFTNK